MSRRRVYAEGTGWLHVPVPLPVYARLLRLAGGDRRLAARLAGAQLAESLGEPGDVGDRREAIARLANSGIAVDPSTGPAAEAEGDATSTRKEEPDAY